MRRFWFLVLLALIWPYQAHATVFQPHSYTLANGLQLVVVENRLSPAVVQMIWYKVGSADEQSGKTGLAHYLEHLMFRGTEQVPAGSYSQTIASLGGRDNAFTSYDYTAYHAVVAAEHLPLVMRLEADRMQNLRITPDTAQPELSVVLNERDQRTDNDPQGRFVEKFRSLLWPDHAYGRPIIGWRPEIEALTVANAENFYRQHYAPNNAIVVISGNVEAAEVLRLATAIYGPVPANPAIPARQRQPAVTLPVKKQFTMRDPQVQQPLLSHQIVVPSYATQKQREAYALEVLAEVLGGGEVGLLYQELVLQQQLASGIDASYDPQTLGDSSFDISATPQSGRKPTELRTAINKYLRQLAKQGIDAKTIADAKIRLQRSASFARDSLMAPAYVFGMALTTGQTVADVENWPQRIKAVSVAEVNQALKTMKKSKHKLTGVLQPQGKGSAKSAAPIHNPVSDAGGIR